MLLAGCGQHGVSSQPAAAQPVTQSEEWKTVSAGDGISVDLPRAGIANNPALDVASRSATGAAVGVKILSKTFTGASGEALYQLTPPGSDEERTLIASMYGSARAGGATVTETFRGAFGDDPDARGGTTDDGKNSTRFLYFRRGDDFVMVIGAVSSANATAAKPDVDRFFRSVRVEGSMIETGHFSRQGAAR